MYLVVPAKKLNLQQVNVYLFLMGVLFAIPHVIWKAVDDNKLKNLVQELNVSLFKYESICTNVHIYTHHLHY